MLDFFMLIRATRGTPADANAIICQGCRLLFPFYRMPCASVRGKILVFQILGRMLIFVALPAEN